MQENEIKIWKRNGDLVDLRSIDSKTKKTSDVAAIIVTRDRPDLVKNLTNEIRNFNTKFSIDIYIIEMGSSKKTPGFNIWYPDNPFKGKCYGHNVGLRLAKNVKNYKYFWFLMNDLSFIGKKDSLDKMIEILNKDKKLAVISPTEKNGAYHTSKPNRNSEYRYVSTCDYLSLLIKSDIIDEIGFLDPKFKYSWGAIHDYSYYLHKNGYRIAYCDKVVMKHFGGTTYGKAKNVIDRNEYVRRAKIYASRYLIMKHGPNWDTIFSSVLPKSIKFNTFKIHRKFWEKELSNV